jgi:hypothetical protein
MRFPCWLWLLVVQCASCGADKPLEEITLIKTLLSEIFRSDIVSSMNLRVNIFLPS